MKNGGRSGRSVTVGQSKCTTSARVFGGGGCRFDTARNEERGCA
jgi:hypothetical protein